jgi:dTDP-N-acetylfucosamine:lipid II N-acetylfucosaminyltransferase
MKYLHIIVNHAYTAPFIELINKNFNPEEHVFYVIRGFSEDKVKIPRCKNVHIINNSKNVLNGFRLLKDMNVSKKIFFHGLFSPYLLGALFFQPWLLKKSSWHIWGGDLYAYLSERRSVKGKVEEFLRKIIIKNLAEIAGSVRGDYELAKKWYKVKGPFTRTMYLTPFRTPDIDKIIENNIDTTDRSTIYIQIGNSATSTNNHFEIIDSLKKFKNENIKIYAPLAYGDEGDYADKVMAYGKAVFDDKFIGLRDFMEFEKFVLFMNKMDILIFNQTRQQAMGNLWLAIYLKKKIFIREESTLWEYYKTDYNLVINKTKSIFELDFNALKHRNEDELEKNKTIVNYILSEKYFVELWRAVFDK